MFRRFSILYTLLLFSLNISAQGTLRVLVQNDDFEPIPYAMVQVETLPLGYTDENGYAVFEEVPAGEYKLAAYYQVQEIATGVVIVENTDTTEYAFMSERKVDMPVKSKDHNDLGEEIYEEVEDMPRFPGCEDLEDTEARKNCASKKMLSYAYSDLNYPPIARENGVQGQAVVRFIVRKDGSITNAEIIENPGAGLGEVCLDIVKSMPKWIPGTQLGQPVNVYSKLTINFKLEEEDIFKVVENMPRFPGCEDLEDNKARKQCAIEKMLNYVYSNLNYPPVAQKNGIEGQALVQFIVRKNGSITNAELLRDPGGGIGEEALRIVKSMPKWIPGSQRGQPVSVYFNLPIKFRLEVQCRKKNNADTLKYLDTINLLIL